MPRIASPITRKVATLHSRWLGDIDDHVIGLAWSPDGTILAAAAIGGPIWLFDGDSGKVQRVLPGHHFGTSSISWNHDGSLLASGGNDGKIRLWAMNDAAEQMTLDGGAAWVERVAWRPHAPLLASAAGKRLKVWNDRGELIREYPDHPSTIADIAWKPGSGEITTAHYGGLSLFSPDSETPIPRHEWQGSTLVLAWSPDGKFIATGDQDATVHFWIARTGRDLQMWGYPLKVRELAWNDTSRYLATGGGDAVIIWDCSGKGPEHRKPLTLSAREEAISALAWQRDGILLASGDRAGQVVLWQPTRNTPPLAVTSYADEIAQLVWSPDSRRIAIGTAALNLSV